MNAVLLALALVAQSPAPVLDASLAAVRARDEQAQLWNRDDWLQSNLLAELHSQQDLCTLATLWTRCKYARNMSWEDFAATVRRLTYQREITLFLPTNPGGESVDYSRTVVWRCPR